MESQSSSLRSGWKSNEEVFLLASGGRNHFEEVNLLFGVGHWPFVLPVIQASVQVAPLPCRLSRCPSTHAQEPFSLSLPCVSIGSATIWNTRSHFHLYFSYLLMTPPPFRESRFLKSRECFSTRTIYTQSLVVYRGLSSMVEINLHLKLKGLGSNPSSALWKPHALWQVTASLLETQFPLLSKRDADTVPRGLKR